MFKNKNTQHYKASKKSIMNISDVPTKMPIRFS